ncbi:hypothetical protein ACT453_54655, partial [Bacillus sp. D-CC]
FFPAFTIVFPKLEATYFIPFPARLATFPTGTKLGEGVTMVAGKAGKAAVDGIKTASIVTPSPSFFPAFTIVFPKLEATYFIPF